MKPRLAALTLLAVVLAPAVPAAAAAPLCHPSPAAAVMLEEVGDAYAILDLSRREWEERLTAVEAGLAERPDDLFLHRVRQDLFRYASKDVREERMAAVREEYARLASAHPGEPVFLYLQGRLADDREGEERAFTGAVEADPGFPWGHLGMVVVELKREEPAKEAAERHLARFAEICPDRPQEILLYSSSVGSPEFWAERLPDLRRRVEAAPAEHAAAFSSLWALEFRLTDVAEHAAVRERVARDVERLAALEERPRRVLSALEEGYELSGQAEAAAEMAKALAAASPCSSESVWATREAWEEEHPRPEAGAGEEAWSQWSRLLGEAALGWLERCPDEYTLWNARLQGLAAAEAPDPDPEELVRTGLRAAEVYGRWPGYSFPSGYEQVAEIFLDREVGLDHVRGLLERAEAEAASLRESRDLSQYPEDRRAEVERNDLRGDWMRDLLRARARIAAGELDPAQELLADLGARLDTFAPEDDAAGRSALAQRGLESDLWKVKADLAEAAQRLPDALAYLLEAEAARPAEAPPWVRGLEPAEAEERISELWARLGGSADALAALRARRAAADPADTLADFSPWKDAEGTLPDFELKDMSGRVWTRADFQGKTVFANAWATWCGPCREELPAVQALHQRLREREDVLVVTLNMDDNTGAIVPYLEKEEFDFPVLLARDFAREALDVFGIPQSWIVDATGALRREQSGFDASIPEAEWIDQVVQEMEKLGAPEGP